MLSTLETMGLARNVCFPLATSSWYLCLHLQAMTLGIVPAVRCLRGFGYHGTLHTAINLELRRLLVGYSTVVREVRTGRKFLP